MAGPAWIRSATAMSTICRRSFRKAQDDGHIELMTCAATHGSCRCWHEDGSIRMQVKQAAQTYEKFLLAGPRGIWLPECAYRPRCNLGSAAMDRRAGDAVVPARIEEFLAREGFDYFIVDTHLLAGGDRGRHRWTRTAIRSAKPGAHHHAPQERDRFLSKSPYCLSSSAANSRTTAGSGPRARPNSGLQVWSGKSGYPGDYAYSTSTRSICPGACATGK